MLKREFEVLAPRAFADFLLEHEAALLEEWAERVRQDPLVPAIHGPIEPVRADLIPELLKGLRGELRAHETTDGAHGLAPREYTGADRAMAALRAQQFAGHSLAGSLAALQHFRSAVLGLLAETESVLDPSCQLLVHAVIDEAVFTVALAIHDARIDVASVDKERLA